MTRFVPSGNTRAGKGITIQASKDDLMETHDVDSLTEGELNLELEKFFDPRTARQRRTNLGTFIMTGPSYTFSWDRLIPYAIKHKVDWRYDMLDGSGIAGWHISHGDIGEFVEDNRDDGRPFPLDTQRKIRLAIARVILTSCLAAAQRPLQGEGEV